MPPLFLLQYPRGPHGPNATNSYCSTTLKAVRITRLPRQHRTVSRLVKYVSKIRLHFISRSDSPYKLLQFLFHNFSIHINIISIIFTQNWLEFLFSYLKLLIFHRCDSRNQYLTPRKHAWAHFTNATFHELKLLNFYVLFFYFDYPIRSKFCTCYNLTRGQLWPELIFSMEEQNMIRIMSPYRLWNGQLGAHFVGAVCNRPRRIVETHGMSAISLEKDNDIVVYLLDAMSLGDPNSVNYKTLYHKNVNENISL